MLIPQRFAKTLDFLLQPESSMPNPMFARVGADQREALREVYPSRVPIGISFPELVFGLPQSQIPVLRKQLRMSLAQNSEATMHTYAVQKGHQWIGFGYETEGENEVARVHDLQPYLSLFAMERTMIRDILKAELTRSKGRYSSALMHTALKKQGFGEIIDTIDLDEVCEEILEAEREDSPTPGLRLVAPRYYAVSFGLPGRIGPYAVWKAIADDADVLLIGIRLRDKRWTQDEPLIPMSQMARHEARFVDSVEQRQCYLGNEPNHSPRAQQREFSFALLQALDMAQYAREHGYRANVHRLQTPIVSFPSFPLVYAHKPGMDVLDLS